MADSARRRAAPAAGRHLIRLAFNTAIFALAVMFLWSVVADIGLQAVERRIASAAPALVVVVFVLQAVRFLLLGLRWEILVRAEAPLGFWAVTEVLMAGNFLALVAPALRVAGPVLRAFYLSKETGRPRARFYGTIVADQTANFTVFALAMILSGALTAAAGGAGVPIGAGLALLFALVGGLWVMMRHLARFQQGEPSILGRVGRAVLRSEKVRARDRHRIGERVIAWWEHLLETLAHALIRKRTWWPSLAVSAILFLVLAIAQQLACRAVGAPVSFAGACFAVSSAAFIQLMAAAPGGVGVTEASLVLAFLALGLDAESAAAATFLGRLANYGVLIPWGGIAFLRLQRRYGPARDEAEGEGDPEGLPGGDTVAPEGASGGRGV